MAELQEKFCPRCRLLESIACCLHAFLVTQTMIMALAPTATVHPRSVARRHYLPSNTACIPGDADCDNGPSTSKSNASCIGYWKALLAIKYSRHFLVMQTVVRTWSHSGFATSIRNLKHRLPFTKERAPSRASSYPVERGPTSGHAPNYQVLAGPT